MKESSSLRAAKGFTPDGDLLARYRTTGTCIEDANRRVYKGETVWKTGEKVARRSREILCNL